MGILNTVGKGVAKVAGTALKTSAVMVVADKAVNIAAEAAQNAIESKIETRSNLIEVPQICDKDFPLSLEQAVELLESYGFKVTAVKMQSQDADVKYRQCFDSQVIVSVPKPKQKVSPDTRIILKYITQDTINESQRLYEVAEQRKNDLAEVRSIKHAERKEKVKRIASDAVDILQGSIKTVQTKIHKSTKKKDSLK